jgi:formylmethanofuran dehydrogenase subunit A
MRTSPGEIVVREGELVRSCQGRTLFAEIAGVGDLMPELREPFKSYYTMEVENFPIPLEDLVAYKAVPAGSAEP